jgi:hypothetical protein
MISSRTCPPQHKEQGLPDTTQHCRELQAAEIYTFDSVTHGASMITGNPVNCMSFCSI